MEIEYNGCIKEKVDTVIDKSRRKTILNIRLTGAEYNQFIKSLTDRDKSMVTSQIDFEKAGYRRLKYRGISIKAV